MVRDAERDRDAHIALHAEYERVIADLGAAVQRKQTELDAAKQRLEEIRHANNGSGASGGSDAEGQRVAALEAEVAALRRQRQQQQQSVRLHVCCVREELFLSCFFSGLVAASKFHVVNEKWWQIFYFNRVSQSFNFSSFFIE